MLINDINLRFNIEKSIACLMVGKTGLSEEKVATKEFGQSKFIMVMFFWGK